MSSMPIIRRYRSPLLSSAATENLKEKLEATIGSNLLVSLEAELCFNVEIDSAFDKAEAAKLDWMLSMPDVKRMPLTDESALAPGSRDLLVEVAPRLSFTTAFSTNAVSVAHCIELESVRRIEVSRRYLLRLSNTDRPLDELKAAVIGHLHDRMTEQIIDRPLQSFELSVKPKEPFEVDIMARGKEALDEVNVKMGLALDAWDIDYYTGLFLDRLGRNPTNVECFDLAQSNSEHSRHWFFKGRLFVDGVEQPKSLFDLIMASSETSNSNNVIKFTDNSSAIHGFRVPVLLPEKVGESARLTAQVRERHILFTAETHNFPTGVAPFPGATTGTGGRIRDVQATGRGAYVVAGTAGYSFGNLRLPGYLMPWEEEARPGFAYPSQFATPAEIAVEASNGASDYGNKFGEPILAGFARSCGLRVPGNGEWREWIKPIMFTGGIGQLEAGHVSKQAPSTDMLVVKVGGPPYRIGVGGGAASSVVVQGDNTAALDFDAVQRGDAEMGQKMNRVVRGCAEAGMDNPVCSVHDQGAGGNGNVLKEICEPAGACIMADNFQLGDPTLSVLELWGAEYQESNALLVKEEERNLLERICRREKCPVDWVGRITGDGRVRLRNWSARGDAIEYPVDLELSAVLGKMPRKEFQLKRIPVPTCPLHLPDGLQVMEALHRVLRLPAVASKRYLTTKVDRSVTGLVAQQQCVGPLHTPLADVAVTALGHFSTKGSATSIGEQPIKGLVDSGCGARLSVAEALTNLSFAAVTCLRDVKVSGNWMWPAKLPGEGAALVEACQAMCALLTSLGVAVDGGKDSLSMAARVGDGGTVKAPGCLVISAYVGCPDVRLTVTPVLKGEGILVWIKISKSCPCRLGGTALAQVFNQLGDRCPDVDAAEGLAAGFNAVQTLVEHRLVTAGHDVSDGGLVTCLLEMAFAGNCGMSISLKNARVDKLSALFHEEPGWVVEVSPNKLPCVVEVFEKWGVSYEEIGISLSPDLPSERAKVSLTFNEELLLDGCLVSELRDVWEETSYHLELRQCNPECAKEERAWLREATAPSYHVTAHADPPLLHSLPSTPSVGILREEGSNGDREMAAAFYMAGFEVWDITMQDLLSGSASLEGLRGVAFVGGFSFADVLGSAKGWAGSVLFHPQLRRQFDAFRARPDTFSLGICNGCQLMAWIGWLDESPSSTGDPDVFLDQNRSERFESRFPTVTVPMACRAMMLKGMQGSRLGVWSAHGEGRFVVREDKVWQRLFSSGQIAIQFVDSLGEPTERYPANPNGTRHGVAGICSPDGRHLAMMPHPERTVQLWQWAWMPHEWREGGLEVSPWLKIFQNAYRWCGSE